MNELIFIMPYLFSLFPLIEEHAIQIIHDFTSAFLEDE